MIIKSLSRKANPAQLIRYALRYSLKENETQARKEHAKVLLRHNIRSKDVAELIAEFKENEKYRIYRRKNSVVLFHTVISFAPDDTRYINIGMLKDISRKFIELRAPNCLNLAVAHLEKQHKHIHIITSGVQVNGRSSRVSKQAFARTLDELEAYQQETYPELEYSKNSHVKTNVRNKEQLIKHLQKSREGNKRLLFAQLEKAYQRSQSKEEFIKALAANGYELYHRNERPQGILAHGKKFRFSSLGFDAADLEKLYARRKESSTLSEILAIRNRMTKQKEIIEGKANNLEDDKELEAIQSIRAKAKELDGLERQGFESK